MTTKDAIEQLKQFPPNSEIVLYDPDWDEYYSVSKFDRQKLVKRKTKYGFNHYVHAGDANPKSKTTDVVCIEF